jgi:hypothetical protein
MFQVSQPLILMKCMKNAVLCHRFRGLRQDECPGAEKAPVDAYWSLEELFLVPNESLHLSKVAMTITES